MEQDTRVWVYILSEMFISYIKIMLLSLPALAMGLVGICIMDKGLRK